MNRLRSKRFTMPPKASTATSEAIELPTNSQRRSSMPRDTPRASRTGRRQKYPQSTQKKNSAESSASGNSPRLILNRRALRSLTTDLPFWVYMSGKGASIVATRSPVRRLQQSYEIAVAN